MRVPNRPRKGADGRFQLASPGNGGVMAPRAA
ncbi:hypothetical protein CFBP498_27370 [Xanthomonas hortorum pv. vitians]|uniref:Uncharacterized protein n=1 Tax=Xanthomonas hortorum pv. vitians TaxID=83224 RepID=A0A6V7DTW6_9XANT|nr:hypothetical protein CFBP498_27370 [Xanthomonas hortorum pv. vitians]CAD0340678.1 hypothetical protein CFBP498_27370 [Xanthomonas hortorum pv. vitians]